MSRISSCASCHGDILIPATAQPLDEMRCPLCSAQFRVQEVLAASILAPPEAILVKRPAIDVPAAVGPRFGNAEAPAEWDTATIAPSAPRRALKKRHSVLGQFIGVVGGGLLGLSLGYIGLLKFGGPRYDFLEIANRLPPWLTAPVAVPFLQKDKPADEPRNDRHLGDLLNESEPPAVEVPGGPLTEAPPAAYGDEPPAGSPVNLTEPPATMPSEPPAAPLSDPAPGLPPQSPLSQTGPRRFTAYTAEDLALAVAETASALGCSACNATGFVTRTLVTGVREEQGARVQQTSQRRIPCEVCGGRPITRITPEIYAKLCHLADVVTFVPKGDMTAWNQREAVQNLLVATGSDQKAAETIGRLAGFQLEHFQHKEAGIALAGTVQEQSQVGSLYAMRIVLFGLPKVVVVVSWRPAQPAISEHDRVLILGSIVDNPAENLVGYEGRLAQVVWGGLPVKLPPQP